MLSIHLEMQITSRHKRVSEVSSQKLDRGEYWQARNILEC